MRIINKMKIGTKLTLGFLIMAVITIIIGAVGSFGVQSIGKNGQDMYNNNFVEIGDIGRVQSDFLIDSINVRQLVLSSVEGRTAYVNRLDVLSKSITTDLDALGKDMKSTEDIKTYNNLKVLIGTYVENRNSTKALVLSNGKSADISKLILSSYNDGKTLNDFITKLSNSNLNRTKQVEFNNVKVTRALNIFIICVCLGAMGLAIFLGIFMTKIIVKPIKKLKEYANRIAIGAVDIKIENESKDEVGDLMASFRKMIENIKDNANIAQKISKGDLTVIINAKSDGDILANSMSSVVSTLKDLEAEIAILTSEAVEGKLSTRGNADKFSGGYKSIVEEVNKTLDAVAGPLNFASGYIKKIANGEELEVIDNTYKGSYGLLVDNISKVRESLYVLVNESGKLSEAGANGELLVRGDLSGLKGGFAQIIKGVNDTLDSITSPLHEAGNVLNKMAINDYTSKMTGSYKGEMKDFAEEINGVHDRLTAIQSIFIEISMGDIGSLANLVKIKKRSEADMIVPSVIATLNTIQDLINESKLLAEAGVNGNLEVRGDTSKFQGGYIDIVSGFNETLDAIEKPINEASEILGKMATGNLTESIKGDYLGSYAIIKDSINDTINSFNEILGNINNSADQVNTGSKQVSYGSQALSQGATEQASSMEELTASITEVASQTKENALDANKANELALSAKGNAEIGNSQMKEMLKSMEEINESSSGISKIIKVIDDIAFQTNILALNAAIEAARAGQAGKGFAVVAEEVRSLSARSAEAAKQTSELIEGSIKKVEYGTKIASGTAKSLNEIVEGIAKAATLVGNIATASNDQATSISQINKGIEQVSQVIQTNSATAEESAAASEELSSQAELLKNMIDNFDLKAVNNTSTTYENKKISEEQLNAKTIVSSLPGEKIKSSKSKISLSDKEFGKY